MPKPVNKMRGEHEIDLDGEVFIVCAELERIIPLMDELGCAGIQDLEKKFRPSGGNLDPRVLLTSFRHLCISGNEEKIGAHARSEHLLVIAIALLRAVFGNICTPEEGEEGENPPAAGVKKAKAA